MQEKTTLSWLSVKLTKKWRTARDCKFEGNRRWSNRSFWGGPKGLKMGSQALIYSFVARGTVVLAEYTAFSGNFSTIAVQCLQKLPATNNKFTYTCDRHTFNYLVDEGFSKCPSDVNNDDTLLTFWLIWVRVHVQISLTMTTLEIWPYPFLKVRGASYCSICYNNIEGSSPYATAISALSYTASIWMWDWYHGWSSSCLLQHIWLWLMKSLEEKLYLPFWSESRRTSSGDMQEERPIWLLLIAWTKIMGEDGPMSSSTSMWLSASCTEWFTECWYSKMLWSCIGRRFCSRVVYDVSCNALPVSSLMILSCIRAV